MPMNAAASSIYFSLESEDKAMHSLIGFMKGGRFYLHIEEAV